MFHSGYGGGRGRGFMHNQGPMINQGMMPRNSFGGFNNYDWNMGMCNVPHDELRKVHCGELRLADVGCKVELSGRVHNQRLGRFLSLRDESGVIQTVASEDRMDLQRRLRKMPVDSYCVLVGTVMARPQKSRNDKMVTGDIEVLIDTFLSVHPKRRRPEDDCDRDFPDSKKKVSQSSAALKLTNEELTKCPTPGLGRFFGQRTHTCGDINFRLVGQDITLVGWVEAKRIGRFITLKDGYSSLQVVPGTEDSQFSDQFQNLSVDNVIVVKGTLSRRPPGHENTRHSNGAFELSAYSIQLIDKHSEPPPVPNEEEMLDDAAEAKESSVAEPEPSKYTTRTHTCGEINESNVGNKVKLQGWLEFSRMRKFVTLRDGYGSIQLVVSEKLPEIQNLIEDTPYESVVCAEGTVCTRPPGQENESQETGAVEVVVTDLSVVTKAKDLPFNIRNFGTPKESLRMKYRYLDLRRNCMQRNLRLRSKVLFDIRKFLIENCGFVEVETPTLFRRTPGGAQEFVVPTENAGEFYSLVQSPQQFKQLLMIGAIDRYFQIAKCYRDEPSRHDRQPEFSQLDIELSFCDREGILNLVEDIIQYSWPEHLAKPPVKFERLTYTEAMEQYGSDKPDLRFGWKLVNMTNIFLQNRNDYNGKIDLSQEMTKEDFAVFAFVAKKGAVLFKDSYKKTLQDMCKQEFSPAIPIFLRCNSIKFVQDKLQTLFSNDIASKIESEMGYSPEDVLFIALGPKTKCLEMLGKARIDFADFMETKEMEVIKKDTFHFAWVVDFPLFTKGEDGTILSTHHPFTQPHPEDKHLLQSDCLKVRGLHYDLVLNGNEVGGGSIRVHDAALQTHILSDILKIPIDSLSHLIKALECGAPPHGGIALGIDRYMAILSGADTIRDVIAFPKGRFGKDPMSGAPCGISEEEVKRYHLKDCKSQQ